MRVLYFHQHFTTPDGSGGTRSYEFARALIARGHRVTMVCGQTGHGGLDLRWDARRNWGRGDVDGIDVISLPLPYSNRTSLARRAWLFIRYALRSTLLALREDYDVLFATSTPLTAGIPGIVVRVLRRKKPFVFEVRDLWPELPRALGMKNPLLLGGMSFLEWASYRSASMAIGLAPGIGEGIRRRAPTGLPVTMIPNGCDLELFHPAKRDRIVAPGIEPGDFVAGFTGAHGIANGLDAVLDAAVELQRRGRANIKLLLIGDGNQKDRLVLRARAEGLNNVIFLPPVKKTAIARITASFDCGLMILANVPAFYYGTSPNKFFDYISCGLPVLCNYPGWLSDLIQQHDCGIAVQPDAPGEFADALCRLADDPATARRVGDNSRVLAERDFARSVLAARFVDSIEKTGGRDAESDVIRKPVALATKKR